MNWLLAQFPTFRAIFVWWRDNLTVGGKVITCAMLVCTPALLSLDSPLSLLLSALLSLLLAAAAVGYWFRPRLNVACAAAPTAVCGESLELVAQAENLSAQPTCDLTLELVDQPGIWQAVRARRSIGQLAGGGSIKLPLTVRPLRRGVFPFPDIRAASTFPLNLVRAWRTHSIEGKLTVLPAYRPLAALDLSRIDSSRAGGQTSIAAAVGQGGEYFGSREYSPGMSVRRWDYSSWARLGQPVVREFTRPNQPTAAIVVDDGVRPDDATPPGGPIAAFEAALSLSAALGEGLTDRGLRILLLAVGGEVHDLAEAGLARQQEAVLHALAAATPAPPDDCTRQLRRLAVAPCAPEAVFVLLHGWDDVRADICAGFAARGGEVIRIFLGEEAARQAGRRRGDVVTSIEEIAAGCVEII